MHDGGKATRVIGIRSAGTHYVGEYVLSRLGRVPLQHKRARLRNKVVRLGRVEVF